MLYADLLSGFFLLCFRDLACNNFSGLVPASVGNLEHLLTL